MAIKRLELILILAAFFLFFSTCEVGFAEWVEPGALPPQTNVAAPVNVGSSYQSKQGGLGVAGGLDFSSATGTKLIMLGKICFGSENDVNCVLNWNALSGAGLWASSTNNSIYNTNNSRVGIGTSTPNKKLHVYDTSNAEIDLQSTPGTNNHWGLYVANSASVNPPANSFNIWGIGMGSAGKNRLTISSGGDVGVSTTNPLYTLDVGGWIHASASPNALIKIDGWATGNPYLEFAQNDVAKAQIQYVDNGDTLRIRNGGNPGNLGIAINTQGKVGIATTTFPSTLDLVVNNRVGAREYCDQAGLNCKTITSMGGGGSSLWATSTPNDGIYYTSLTGKVGIGTSSPAYPLHVVGYESNGAGVSQVIENTNTAAVNNYAGVMFKLGGVRYGGIYGGTVGGAGYDLINGLNIAAGTTVQDIGFRVGPSITGTGGSGPAMVIKSTGKVGIGVTNPESDFQVGLRTSISTASPNSISLGGTFSSVAGSNLKLKLYDDTGTSKYGFGVSSSKLDYAVPSGASHVFYINGTEVSRINSNGNVGIGTNIPNKKLSVIGAIGINSDSSWSAGDQSFLYLGADNHYIKGSYTGNDEFKGYSGIDLSTNTGIKMTILDSGTVTVNGGLAVGSNSIVGPFALASGVRSQSNGTGSFASGWENIASGNNSVALGSNSTASAGNSFVMGQNSTSSGPFSTAFGNYNIASGALSFVVGSLSRAEGQSSIALGNSAIAHGLESFAVGNSSLANSQASYAIGNSAQALNNNSYAIGDETVASGYGSMALGRKITVSGNYSVGIGVGLSGGGTLSQNNTFAIMGGNVGIGTNAPSSKLSIEGNIAGSAVQVSINNSSASTDDNTRAQICTSVNGKGSSCMAKRDGYGGEATPTLIWSDTGPFLFVGSSGDKLLSIYQSGKVNIGNGSSYSGKVVCYTTGGELGHCTTAVSSSGGCTCVAN